jgi:hypothetical protein
MRWLSLFPHEMQAGDTWGGEEPMKKIVSIEPVESPEHCLVVFDDDTEQVWPLRAPVRIGREEG